MIDRYIPLILSTISIVNLNPNNVSIMQYRRNTNYICIFLIYLSDI